MEKPNPNIQMPSQHFRFGVSSLTNWTTIEPQKICPLNVTLLSLVEDMLVQALLIISSMINPSLPSIVLLEARQACLGATARNGMVD